MTKLISTHNRSATPPATPLPHARLHDLRHLVATTLLLARVPVHLVAARLGHADPAVTLRVYSGVRDGKVTKFWAATTDPQASIDFWT